MVLCFIIFHLLHYTAQVIHPEFKQLVDAEGRHDIYKMLIVGFRDPLASGFYIVAVGLLGLHLNHGFQSMFQTLGLNSHKVGLLIKRTGQAVSWFVFLGYASIPVAVLTGIVK